MKTKGKITELYMENYGMLRSFSCKEFSNINLVIGKNGMGKTFFLKSLYSAIKTVEDYKRGDDNRSVNEILAEKLRWTFQAEKIGDLVTKNAAGSLRFSFCLDDEQFSYQFSRDASKKISTLKNNIQKRESNSIFIPAKEVLSLYNIILKSRELDKAFGFDDTYYDLAKALRISPQRGKNYTGFKNSRKILSKLIDGGVVYDEAIGKWYYRKGNQKFSIGVTSEGVKKIAILDRLLTNKYLDKYSIIFIDEIESALHPSAIADFLELINIIANEMGIQVFISSHSYFVIKRLYLIAQKTNNSVTCISLNDGDLSYTIHDLLDGMPTNSIIDESIRIYEEEISEVL